jgi:N-glycosylase/DNA lyase
MISSQTLNHIQNHILILEELGMQNLTLEEADRFVPEEDRVFHQLLVELLGKDTQLKSVVFKVQQINYIVETTAELYS